MTVLKTSESIDTPKAELEVETVQSVPSVEHKPSSKFIAPGDVVIVFLSRDRPPIPLTVSPGESLMNSYGLFAHNDMVGLPFGAKLASRNRRGFIHLLRPNPELWTLALPHRTQILYSPDMSFIASHLGLTPGAKVIEAGTGSGSFSHYAARTVARNHLQSSGIGWKGTALPLNKLRAKRGDSKEGDGSEDEMINKEPVDEREAAILEKLASAPDSITDSRNGRVWSFEFHAERALKAWNEFEEHGLFPTLSLRHRNVVKNGFGLEGVADAIFLDLPAPWQALQHAARAMRHDVACRICCFSPCVEQVLKTVAALRKGGATDEIQENNDGADGDPTVQWTDIETYECLQRTHISVWAGPGTQVPFLPIDDAILRIRQVQERRSRRREVQIERTRKERLARETGEGDQEISTGDKRKREEANGSEDEDVEGNMPDTPPQGDGASDLAWYENRVTRDEKSVQRSNVYGKSFPEMRGHTSYLTFATLLPRLVKQEPDPLLENEKLAEERKKAQAEKTRQRKAAKQTNDSQAREVERPVGSTDVH